MENSETSNNQTASGFIDDYSHLRLSYYQLRGRNNSLSFDQSNRKSQDTQDNSTLNHTARMDVSVCESPVVQDISIKNHGCTERMGVSGSESSVQDIEIERQRRREYYISQIPDLPHPSYTMASIIAAKSRQMGGNFAYNNRIEKGNAEIEFSPRDRSTMLPCQFKREN
ncbi:uncharacterized protein LOC133528179 [Cydia pomonella]|uniref:uncharacterized protein LOC133528179 n=1 Tax=Cydia pomonella TaxID=82600 RepID=UPI002ADE3412|nr:uncharacterized protein LOC133528179 [Cydia pomonella]